LRGLKNSFDFCMKPKPKEKLLHFSYAPFIWTKWMNGATKWKFPIHVVFLQHSYELSWPLMVPWGHQQSIERDKKLRGGGGNHGGGGLYIRER
jgi:hypothetical protein